MKTLSIDDVYDIIGHFGRSQFVYFFTIGLVQVLGAHHMLLSIFIGLETPFLCYTNENNGSFLYNKCPENVHNHCLHLEFNTSTFISVASEWNFICDEKYKLTLIQSVWMGGIMVGSLFLGLADHIGRLNTLVASLMCAIGFEAFSALYQSYILLLIFRFLGGISFALSTSGFVLMQELIGASYRSATCLLMSVFFAFGIGILSLLAASLKEWRSLTLVASLSGLCFLILPSFLPESPRWLLGKGEVVKAKQILENMARKNGTDHLLPPFWKLSRPSVASEKKPISIFELFSNSFLLQLTLIMLYSWFVNSALYYGLTMAATSLPGNVFVSTTLNGLVEIPALIFGIFIIDRLGRRVTICGAMFCSGFACTLIPFLPPLSPATSVCALIGKLSISASFGFIYIQSGEIFPTVLRNTGLGLVSWSARVGGILAPFILSLRDVIPNLDFITMGILALVGGLLNLRLPETLGKPLPESISDLLHENSMVPRQEFAQSARHANEDDQEALLGASASNNQFGNDTYVEDGPEVL